MTVSIALAVMALALAAGSLLSAVGAWAKLVDEDRAATLALVACSAILAVGAIILEWLSGEVGARP